VIRIRGDEVGWIWLKVDDRADKHLPREDPEQFA